MYAFRLGCAGLLLCVGLLLAACSPSSPALPSTPEAAVQALVHATAKQDVDKAMALYALGEVPEGQMLQVRGRIQMIVGQASTHMETQGGVERVDIVESTIADDGQSANVRATIVFGNGREDTANVRLRREDGQWKVIYGR